MSKLIKNISIIINLLILGVSIIWLKKTNFDYEPITICLGQVLALVILLFGDKIYNKFRLKNISNSKVKIDTHKEDDAEYSISNIKENSEINIRKK
ncbi:MAG: hypothetical protein I8H68_03025 [Flavobacteriia bacterium]|nr:hypothetical protein [Flavobacteriia bacterium]